MATTDLIGAPERTSTTRLTAPLPQDAVAALHRLELAFAPKVSADPVLAEQLRIERLVSGLRVGESTVINGTPVTAVSLAVAEAITVHETAARRAAQLAAKAATGVDLPALDVRAWEFAEDLMAGARATLAGAGQLHLIEVA